MTPKTRNLIIATLRQASLRSEDRRLAKEQAKVAPATYMCKGCKKIVYTGTKSEEDVDFKEVFTQKGFTFIKGKIHMDHINPVISPYKGSDDWSDAQVVGEYVLRLFCNAENYQALCEECHKTKTANENKLRGKSRTRRKTAKKRVKKFRKKS